MIERDVLFLIIGTLVGVVTTFVFLFFDSELRAMTKRWKGHWRLRRLAKEQKIYADVKRMQDNPSSATAAFGSAVAHIVLFAMLVVLFGNGVTTLEIAKIAKLVMGGTAILFVLVIGAFMLEVQAYAQRLLDFEGYKVLCRRSGAKSTGIRLNLQGRGAFISKAKLAAR